MTEQGNCPQCGRALPADSPQGLCPACLLKRGLESNTIGDSAGGGHARWTPPPAEELAASFPELDILELIGRGGMGAVYKARQKELDRLVALKILPPEIGQDAGFAQRFAREAQAMARLSHPNIVTIHDFGQRGKLYFFLMEYVDGLSLRQLLDRGTACGERSRTVCGERSRTVSPKEALAIVPQICDALQYAHDRGIVHRGIKPENILLNRAGQVKIADFGLAKLIGTTGVSPARGEAVPASQLQQNRGRDARDTIGEKVMGTPQYMAPEQIDRPGEVDHRADIYSLGVVFYQMLTGELPLGKFEPPSRKVLIDVRLDEVVLRALEKEPARRYQQVSQLKTEVETIVQTTPSSAPEEGSRPGAYISWKGRKRSWYVPLVGVRNNRRVIHWPGVVGAGLIMAAIFAAGAVIADLVLYRFAGFSLMGYGMVAVIVLGTIIVLGSLGSAIGRGLRQPIERLWSLDTPPGAVMPEPSPEQKRQVEQARQAVKLPGIIVLFIRVVYAVAVLAAMWPFFGLGMDPGDPHHLEIFILCLPVALGIAFIGGFITLISEFIVNRLHGGQPPLGGRIVPLSPAQLTALLAVLLGVAYLAGLSINRMTAKDYKDRPSSSFITQVATHTGETPPAASPWRVTLPSGVTVELVGVSENPSQGKPWWRPDGSPLEHAPEHCPSPAELLKLDPPGNDFVILVKGIPWPGEQGDFEVLPRIDINPPDPTPPGPALKPGEVRGEVRMIGGGSRWHDIILPPVDTPDGPRVTEVYVLSESFPKSQAHTTIKMGLAAGPWKTIATHKIDGKAGQSVERRGIGGTNLDVSFGMPFEADFGRDMSPKKAMTVHITVSHNVAPDQQVRVIAVLADGEEAIGATPQVSNGHTQQITASFAGLRLEDVKEFQLQTRPYEWAEFKNVSLRPAGTLPATHTAITQPAPKE